MIEAIFATIVIIVSLRLTFVALDEVNTLSNDIWWEHNGENSEDWAPPKGLKRK